MIAFFLTHEQDEHARERYRARAEGILKTGVTDENRAKVLSTVKKRVVALEASWSAEARAGGGRAGSRRVRRRAKPEVFILRSSASSARFASPCQTTVIPGIRGKLLSSRNQPEVRGAERKTRKRSIASL